MSVSNLQLTANRENARRSTGPRTPEGKKRSSLNALRHGLTGQVVVMPDEDLKAYLSFTERYVQDLAPLTEPERQLAQDIANCQWRLNRSASIEQGVYALGHHDFANLNDVDHPEIHAALTAASTYLSRGKQLESLSRQENRLRRSLQNSLKLYHDMQAQRREREWEEMIKAGPIYKTHKMQNLPYNPTADGFVLSTAQIERRLSREDHYDDAKVAERCGYDEEEYLAYKAGQ